MRILLFLLLFSSTAAFSQLYLKGGVNYAPHKITGEGDVYKANLHQKGISLGFDYKFPLLHSSKLKLGLGVSGNLLLKNTRNDYTNFVDRAITGANLTLDDNMYWGTFEFPIYLNYSMNRMEFGAGFLLTGMRKILGSHREGLWEFTSSERVAGYYSLLFHSTFPINDFLTIRSSVFVGVDPYWSVGTPGGRAVLNRNGLSFELIYLLRHRCKY